MAILNTLAQYAASETFDNLPEKVVQEAKRHILDNIGNSCFNFSGGVHNEVTNVLKRNGGKPEATVFGEGFKVPCTSAAFLNSVICAMHGGGHKLTSSHPCYSTIPAALAVGERENIGGRKLITGIVAGYEIFCRIGKAVYPSSYNRGFHITATVGPFSAAASAGNILGLDATKMAHALSLAGALGAGYRETFATPARAIQVGRSCESGVLSALLAQENLSGSSTILEGKAGFCHAMADEYNLEDITWGLGRSYEILNTYIKAHGGCRGLHSSIDVAIKTVREHKLKADDIEGIKIFTSPTEVMLCGSSEQSLNPKTGDDAAFSIPFGVAVGILEGNVGPEKCTEAKLKDSGVRKLMKRIEVEIEKREFPEQYFASIEIKMRDGEVIRDSIDYPKGEPEWPLTNDEVNSKFRRLGSFMLVPDEIENVLSTVYRLDSIENIAELISLLHKKGVK